MGTPIRVLIIEDSENDALLTLRELKKGGYEVEHTVVETPKALKEALENGQWDIILSDFQMPSFDGREALRIVKEHGVDVPFIVISGVLVEEDAVEILKGGASDYVKKGNWARLLPAVGRELREAQSRRERMRAQKEKAKAQAQYQNLFETAVEGIFQSTPAGHFIHANPAMAQLLGYDSPEDLIQRVTDIPFQLYVHASARLEFLNTLRTVGVISGFEAKFYRKDGSTLWGSINARGIFDELGELDIIEGFIMDISERKRAERDLAEINHQLEKLVAERTIDLERKALELQQANLRLKELDQLKTAFLSSVSHELRTPLTSVLGFAKLIHRDFCKNFLPKARCEDKTGKMGDRICTNLDIIVQEGERLTRLINDFLDLTRIEAGRMTWDDQTINSYEVLNHAAKAVSGLYAHNDKIELMVDVPENLPEVIIDPDRMTQVVINLLNNAAKFTPEGTVTLSARALEDTSSLEVRVVDTGVGIPPDDLEKVFTKFHQVKGQETMDTGSRGSGLGLSISQQIVEHYGGTIRVESEVGKGSTFIIVFPFAHSDGRGGK